jgi:hypothetical protein
MLPSEDYDNAVVRELFEGPRLTLSVDDLTMLSGEVVWVPSPDSKTQHVYV